MKRDGVSVLNHGDLSVVSFHATKVYSTIEGGAIISHSSEMKYHIDNLKNFGFRGETVVAEPGINAKLNEVQAAYGLLQLKYIDKLLHRRKDITHNYRELLADVPGLRFIPDMDRVTHGYSYFPVLIDHERYGISRDDLYAKLRDQNIHARRYFYPLISQFEPYCKLPTAKKEYLPNATIMADRVLCLPIYPDLTDADIQFICSVIREKK